MIQSLNEQTGNGSEQRPVAEPERRFRRDIFGDAGFQFGRNLRHGLYLHEVEIIEQADPHDAEQDMEVTQYPVGIAAVERIAMKTEDNGEEQYRPQAQNEIQITHDLSHGCSFPQYAAAPLQAALAGRSEAHTSELQSLMRTSYAVFC